MREVCAKTKQGDTLNILDNESFTTSFHIAHLADKGHPAAEIARRLQISARTVRHIVKQYTEEGTVEPRKRSGGPRTVNTLRLRKVIKKRIDRNNGLSMHRMAVDLGVSRRTTQKIVKQDLVLRSCRLYCGQTLTEAD
ncbi:unnamed protein product [Heligmosomoides polygyrus]|uniref:Helix-turn-helix domain-containing protein n=1 Tax=Heligmosomoides polygyrus TaxID=6339 RepID=A0A183FWV8_HELPZ|nr:unnamed protein product [Heligmosomoides polygyrus]